MNHSDKTIPFQFRIPERLRDFLKQRFPKNTSKGVNEIIALEQSRIEMGIKRLEMLKNPRASFNEIKRLEKLGEPLNNLHYDFLFNLIKHGSTLWEKDDYYEVKHALGQFIEPVDLILHDIKRTMPNNHDIEYIDYLAEKVLSKEYRVMATMNGLTDVASRLFNVLAQYKEVDGYFRIGLNRFTRVIESLPEKVLHSEFNGTPVVYGASKSELMTSVVIVQALNSETGVILIKKTAIGSDSAENFIEYIISSYLDSLEASISIQDFKWVLENENGDRYTVFIEMVDSESFKMTRLVKWVRN